MKEMTDLLAHWREIEPTRITLSRIKLDEKFQPRNPWVAPYVDRQRLEAASDAHVSRLSELVEDADVDAVLVAELDGRHVLIDGHHRLKAYRKAAKRDLPARVLAVTEDQALMVSKLVNCDGVKLPMHAEQSRECAWQFIAKLTDNGRLPLPSAVSKRHIGRTFGTSRETVGSMLRQLPMVRLAEFTREQCDPGTGWPLWRLVKGNAFRDQFSEVSDDAAEQHRAERLAERLASLIGTNGVDRFVRAVRLLKIERQAEVAQATEELAGQFDEADSHY